MGKKERKKQDDQETSYSGDPKELPNVLKLPSFPAFY